MPRNNRPKPAHGQADDETDGKRTADGRIDEEGRAPAGLAAAPQRRIMP
ncbi:hypothetical protein BSIN_2855 [Burkholderia singularis]|uniref:Uncharacterized protein n=1 Tax=Burkholderia singularis TaxID=1503053 RepID=A0A238H2Z7_9BURK|nr:hypothetical protein BSIN_2855 [Burkholderia singularis]